MKRANAMQPRCHLRSLQHFWPPLEVWIAQGESREMGRGRWWDHMGMARNWVSQDPFGHKIQPCYHTTNAGVANFLPWFRCNAVSFIDLDGLILALHIPQAPFVWRPRIPTLCHTGKCWSRLVMGHPWKSRLVSQASCQEPHATLKTATNRGPFWLRRTTVISYNTDTALSHIIFQLDLINLHYFA